MLSPGDLYVVKPWTSSSHCLQAGPDSGIPPHLAGDPIALLSSKTELPLQLSKVLAPAWTSLPSSSLLHVLAVSPLWTPVDPLQTSKGTLPDSYMASPLSRTVSPPGPQPAPWLSHQLLSITPHQSTLSLHLKPNPSTVLFQETNLTSSASSALPLPTNPAAQGPFGETLSH